MTRTDVSGWLLVASFALWFPAAVLPARIWTAPYPERLALIARQRRRWQLVNISIAAAAVLLVLGFTALAEPLRRQGAAPSARGRRIPWFRAWSRHRRPARCP